MSKYGVHMRNEYVQGGNSTEAMLLRVGCWLNRGGGG